MVPDDASIAAAQAYDTVLAQLEAKAPGTTALAQLHWDAASFYHKSAPILEKHVELYHKVRCVPLLPGMFI